MTTLPKDDFALKAELAALGEKTAKARGLLKSLEATLGDRTKLIEEEARKAARDTVADCERRKREALDGVEAAEERRAKALASLQPEKDEIARKMSEADLKLAMLGKTEKSLLERERSVERKENESDRRLKGIAEEEKKTSATLSEAQDKLAKLERKDSDMSEKEAQMKKYERNACLSYEALMDEARVIKESAEQRRKEVEAKLDELRDEEKRIKSERLKLAEAIGLARKLGINKP